MVSMMQAARASSASSGGLALVLTAAVFFLDCLTPLGYAVPVLYLIPLVLIGRRWWRRGVYWFALGATILAFVGYFAGPDGGWIAPALFNRGSSVLVLWGAAFALSLEKRTEWKLAQQADLNRAILDAVTAQITLLDREGAVIHPKSIAGTDSLGHSESAFLEALHSPLWTEIGRRSEPVDPADPDQYLAGVWEVVKGRRTVYSTEYGRMTSSRFRWYLLYARAFKSREGAVVAHIDMTERREAQDALQQREREIQLLIDAREALSRDLHDEVIQRLYGVGLKLTAWRRRAGDAGSPYASRFGEVIFDIDQVIRQVRGYIDGTGRVSVEGKDLPLHAQQLIASMVKDAGVDAEVRIDAAAASDLTPGQLPHVLAMLREAVSNALQHASASRVTIALARERQEAVLAIEDDGRGFDVTDPAQRVGRGLKNLQARAARLGGRVVVQSAPGQGTSVRVEFPLGVSCEVR